MIEREVVIGFDFNARTIYELNKNLVPYQQYPIFIKYNDGQVDVHSTIGLLYIRSRLHKGDTINLLMDMPDYMVQSIINIFSSNYE